MMKRRRHCESFLLFVSPATLNSDTVLSERGGEKEGGRQEEKEGWGLGSRRCYMSCSLAEIASVLSRLKNAQALPPRCGQHPWRCSIITAPRKPPPLSFLSKVGRFSSPGLSCSWKSGKSRPTRRDDFSRSSECFINKYTKERATVSLWRKLIQGLD